MARNELMESERTGLEAAFEKAGGEMQNMSPTPAIGQQIETVPIGAQKVAVYRDETRILQKIKAFAAAAGDDFYYQWEVTKKDSGKDIIEGASIDCALYVVRTYGNCDVDVRVVDQPDSWIFYARFTDFETGFRLMRAYQQRKSQNIGKKMDADRARDIVFQIGQSKAIRNVICNALRPFTDFAFEEAKSALVDKVGRRLEFYRGKVAQRLSELDCTVDRVERIVGRKIDEWHAKDVAKVIAQLQAVTDGMIGIDDVFPAPNDQEGQPRPQRADFVEDERAPKTIDAEGDGAPKTSGNGVVDQRVEHPEDKMKPAVEETPATPPAGKKKGATVQKPAEPETPQAALRRKGDDLSLWLADHYDDVDKATNVDDVEAVRQSVENELTVDHELYTPFAVHANARMRSIRGGK